MTAMIELRGIGKSFGRTEVLRDLDLTVERGSVFALLGPNGAGKTTTVRMLTTLTKPDAGWARVAGHDVVREAKAVQAEIGVTAQDATVDEMLTGRQNIVMIGRLSGLRRADARRLAGALLERFELADAGDPQSVARRDQPVA